MSEVKGQFSCLHAQSPPLLCNGLASSFYSSSDRLWQLITSKGGIASMSYFRHDVPQYVKIVLHNNFSYWPLTFGPGPNIDQNFKMLLLLRFLTQRLETLHVGSSLLPTYRVSTDFGYLVPVTCFRWKVNRCKINLEVGSWNSHGRCILTCSIYWWYFGVNWWSRGASNCRS